MVQNISRISLFFLTLALLMLGGGKSYAEEGILPGGCVVHAKGKVISHSECKTYTFNRNALKGIATESMGSQQFEIWRSSWEVGGATPKHTHETEEIFIFLKGKGRAVIGDEEFYFEAPCTIICPANVPHQLFNAGDEPTDSILVLGVGSKIVDGNGNEMILPWRD